MSTGTLGRIYHPGEVIIRQGQIGDCMYVIQEGQVEVLIEEDGGEVLLAVRGEGDFVGEMAIFEQVGFTPQNGHQVKEKVKSTWRRQ